MKLGKPIKYLAVEPGEVVHRVKKLVNENAEKRVQKLEGLKGSEVLLELNTLHKQGIEFIEPADLSGAIRGRHNLYTHLELMIRNAKKSVSIMTTAKGVMRKIEALNPEFEKLSKKGIKIKIAANLTKENKQAIEDVRKFAEVKSVNDINARFCIVDNKEILFMVLDDEETHPSYDLGIWINTPYFATALNNLFELAWKNIK